MITANPAADHARAPTEADLSVIHGTDHTIVRLSGDLDIATAPQVRERLVSLLRPGLRLLILDLSDVAFCDAAGLAVLIGAQRRATPLGATLRLAAPSAQMAGMLRVTGLDRSFTIHPTTAAARGLPLARRG